MRAHFDNQNISDCQKITATDPASVMMRGNNTHEGGQPLLGTLHASAVTKMPARASDGLRREDKPHPQARPSALLKVRCL